MERLTKYGETSHENGVCCTHFNSKECHEVSGNCAYGCKWEEEAWSKLARYEDLEEQLEKVYGEHDGLLETVVKSLVKHNGEKPNKARLLTDEDADRWERVQEA